MIGAMEMPPDFKYREVVLKGKPRHDRYDRFSIRHPTMPPGRRAKLFAPFAALTGYDEMVDEEARLTEIQIDPGESDLDRLDRKFRRLSSLLADRQRPYVSVLLFVPDARKAGGRYETVVGFARRLDECEKRLVLLGSGSPAQEISLNLDRILDLSGSDLENED